MKIGNILISQPQPASLDKSPFAELIDKHKLKADFVPFIKVQGVSAKEFRSQRIDILAHTALIFTSRTTIDNFFRVADECRVTIGDDMKYFCVTEAIALYLQKYILYRKRKIFFGKGTFADLMDIIIKHKEEKFLIALSEPHKPEIPKALDKAKIKYNKVILTRTESNDVKSVAPSAYDLLVFYSPAEIHSLVETFGAENIAKCNIATFGTGTAKTALDAKLNVCVLAPTKESPSMVMALDKFIAKYNKGEEIDTTYISAHIREEALLKEQLLAKVKTVSKVKKSTKKPSLTVSTVKKTIKPGL